MTSTSSRIRIAALVLGTFVTLGSTSAGDWPQWRGPDGTGVSKETGLPVEWNSERGIAWTCELPRWGNSTPAIWGDAIFLTAHEGESLLVLRISKKTGEIVWTRTVGTGTVDVPAQLRKSTEERKRQKFHQTQNLASPSPVTDGERVIVHFGNGDLASYDFDGQREWKRNLQEDYGTYTIWWGHANSPVLHDNLVISVCMQDSLLDLQDTPSPSYVVAHDKKTGAEVWKTPRMTGATSEPCDAYTTPIFRSTAEGLEMIVVGGTWVDAYDPASGKQLWCLRNVGGNRTITGPALGKDTLYFTVGMRGPVTALRLGAKGSLPGDAIAWRYDQTTPDSPCPALWDGLLFIINDGGIATCLDARTGERYWRERIGENHRASPLAAEGRIYFLSMSGTCTVIAASREFKKLAENEIDDTTIASLAVSDGRLYLRGHKALYCLGEPRK